MLDIYILGAQIHRTEPTATNREKASQAFKCFILSFGGCFAARDEALRRHKAMRGRPRAIKVRLLSSPCKQDFIDT